MEISIDANIINVSANISNTYHKSNSKVLTAVNITIEVMKCDIKLFIHCDCLFQYRMKMPCKHSVSLEIHIDQHIYDDESELKHMVLTIPNIGFDSIIEVLRSLGVSSRWTLHGDNSNRTLSSKTRKW